VIFAEAGEWTILLKSESDCMFPLKNHAGRIRAARAKKRSGVPELIKKEKNINARLQRRASRTDIYLLFKYIPYYESSVFPCTRRDL
jgi:hypothetical protein